ncbi:MAG: c-type cytochrome [Acidimicrobiaceae bacterium]|nr:c-type cytochrome [Acidimicrobiaceae bacterium]
MRCCSCWRRWPAAPTRPTPSPASRCTWPTAPPCHAPTAPAAWAPAQRRRHGGQAHRTQMTAVVADGVRTMPANSGKLTATQIAAVVAYVRS